MRGPISPFYVACLLACLVRVQSAGRPVVSTAVTTSSSTTTTSSSVTSSAAVRPAFKTSAAVSSSSSKAAVGRPVINTSTVLAGTSLVPSVSSSRSIASSRQVSGVSRSSGASASASAVPLASTFASTLQGKVLYGYQAWFGTVDNYTHWTFNDGPGRNATSQFDFFPDTSQYPEECLFDSGFHFANGSSAKLYSAACEGVIAAHFRWMEDAGIDGLIVQRFIVNRIYPSFTRILQLVRKYSELYGKVFMVEYDLSNLSTTEVNNLTAIVQEDFDNIILPLTSSTSYLHEQGMPAFMIFGEGIRTNVSPAQCETLNQQIIDLGMHLVLAPNWPWYDAYEQDPTDLYASAYDQADTISPWAVGSYSAGSDYTTQHETRKAAQDPILRANNQTYAPVIWPGFSWHNLMHNGNTPPLEYAYDQNPRYNGTFLQQQIDTVLNDNSTYFVMIAMFDEVNEGTACAPTLRSGQIVDGTFVGSDAQGDPGRMFYLEAGGEMGKRLRQGMGL